MEPCAPGTEGDHPIMYSSLNKQENEKERLLKQKAILRNGKYENVFELNYINGLEHWYCKACECPVMGRVFQHELGRRHVQNIATNNRHMDRKQREETPDKADMMSIAPGEPAPPGIEELDKTCQIQDKLDGFKAGPLVALEYVLEMQDYDTSKEPVYLCTLCDKRGDPRTVLTHLASYNHITQYLKKHFPTCYRTLVPYMVRQHKRNWQLTLQKIAEGIEQKFGRLRPHPIEKDKFENDKLHYFQMIAKGRHFSELSGYTFEELVVPDELTKVHDDEKGLVEVTAANPWPGNSSVIEKPFKKKSPSPPVVAMPKRSKIIQPGPAQKSSLYASQSSMRSRRQSLSSVSSVSSDDLRDSVKKPYKEFQSNRSPTRGRMYARNDSPSSKRSASPPFRRNDRYREKSNDERDDASKKAKEQKEEKLRKIEEFRKLARAIENDMHKTLKQHEKNPEKHPQYSEEWKKFWNMRYKQLQVQGVDVAKYDFKPEWIEFWNKKMIELHSDELRNRKEALRKRLGLPDEINPIKFSIGGTGSAAQIVVTPKPNLPMAAEPDEDNEVIVIDDREEDRQRRKRSHSPWEKRASPKPRSSQEETSPYMSRRRKSKEESPSRKRTAWRERSREYYRKSKLPSHRESSRTKDHLDRYDRSISRSKDEDRESRSYSRERKSPSVERVRERREYERKRSEYRESSFERDLKARERIRTVADLPWEREKHYRNVLTDFYQPSPIMRDVSRKPQGHPIIPQLPEEEEDTTEVNVVDVLRILTALEERLGSLGPKVIDLLAQALAMEKKEANSSESLLDSDIINVLFETIKEKLKGQLLTGLVDHLQERAFKKAIKKIASLLHLASERKKQKTKASSKVKALSVPGVGTIDRAAIAKQIANALIAQGKTDVTQAELEQLINAVVGMAEASKNSNKPMTTADFVEKIGSAQPQTSTSSRESDNKIEELDKLVEPLTPSPGKSSIKDMENLSDTDLQTLLQNFKDLSNEEQHNLINYLKKLEYQEPERVEKLRSFVNLESCSKNKDNVRRANIGRESPFSNRLGSLNPASEDLVQIESEDELETENEKPDNKQENTEQFEKIHVDSEEEDYTFEDVVKTVSMNVKEKAKEIEPEETQKKQNDLVSAKNLISNLMSNISKRNESSKGIDLLGLGTEPPANTPVSISNIPASTAEFAKTLSNISLDNLANIVSTVKHMTNENAEKNFNNLERTDKIINFEQPFSSNKLHFDPGQLEKSGTSFDESESFFNRGFPPRVPPGFERNSILEPSYRDFNQDPASRNVGPAPGTDQMYRRDSEPLFRKDDFRVRDKGGFLQRMPGPMGVLPTPLIGSGPRNSSPSYGTPSFSVKPNTFNDRPIFNNFQPQLNQYSNNPRGPRLNLLDRSTRPGNVNDFNNRNNYSRW